MSLTIFFDPEYITINSIAYSLDPEPRSNYTLTPSRFSQSWSSRTPRSDRPQPPRSAQIQQPRVWYDGATDKSEEEATPSISIHEVSSTETIQAVNNGTPKVHFSSTPMFVTPAKFVLQRASTSSSNPFPSDDD